MIYRVFYQETKERNPRREQTKVLYLGIDATTELEGRAKTRKLVEEKTPYNVEFTELLSDKYLAYERETGVFKSTELQHVTNQSKARRSWGSRNWWSWRNQEKYLRY